MSGIKQLIVLALALPTAQAFCCFWSSTNDACECDAVASDGSWCAASEDQCLQCGDARWCDDEPEEPEDGAVGMRAANRKRALLPTTVTTGDGAEAAANPRARKLRNPMKNPKQFAPKTNAFSAPGAPAGGAGGQLELEYTTN